MGSFCCSEVAFEANPTGAKKNKNDDERPEKIRIVSK
jgi:hypothetical protein